MSDRSTTDEFETIKYAADASFADLARTHDTLIAKAVEHYRNNDKSTDAMEVVKAGHASRLADVIKAIMLFRFPEASDDWFGVSS
jgi:hypothetical protein